MGSTSSNPFREGGQLMSDYVITGKNPEQFLTFLTHKRSQKQYLLRQLTYTEQRQYTINSEKLKQRKVLKNKHLTHLERIQQRNQDNMCSNFFKIYTLWEFSSKSLLDQIKERGLQRKPFENIQIWSILACSIMGLATLQEKDIRHECLTTRAILMENDGNIKIVDPLAAGLQSNFQSIFNNRTLKNVYLSPEQCEAVQSQKPIINKNPFKNDVFTLGMILLQCGLLQRQDLCYLDDCSRINWSMVEQNLNKFGNSYQGELKQMLTLMLQRDIRSRPDWLDLDKFVKKGSSKTKNRFIQQAQTKRDHFIKRTAQNSLLNPKQNANIYDPAISNQYQLKTIPLSNTQQNQQYFQSNLYSTQPNNYSSQNNFLPVSRPLLPNDFAFSNPKFNSLETRNISFIPHSSNSLLSDSKFPQSNIQSSYLPLRFESKDREFMPNIESKALSTQPYYNSTQHPYQNNLQKLSNYSTNIPTNPSNMFLKKQNKNTNQFNYYSSSNDNIGVKEKFNLIQKPLNITSNNFKLQQTSDLNGYSPMGNNQHIRQAQSINYQVFKSQSSPNTQQESKNQALTFPFEPKIPVPSFIQTISVEMQPQYVEQHFKIGSKYEGYKLNGLRHGKGKFYYQDGGSYDGQWKNNKMEGFGILYYQSNLKAYQGTWVNDQFQGYGKLFNQNPAKLDKGFDFTNFSQIQQFWEYYEGDFNSDQKDGKGKLKFSNGQYFQGTFKNDMVEGEGIYHCKDGQKIHGIWSQNHLINQLT